MTTLFREIDDIISLGKWAYLQIPQGDHCGKCLILDKYETSWACGLRPSIFLIYDKNGPFKDDRCPLSREGR